MLLWIINKLFKCMHRRTTFPITPTRKGFNAPQKGPYIVCLDCGKEFGYNWSEMKVEKPIIQNYKNVEQWAKR